MNQSENDSSDPPHGKHLPSRSYLIVVLISTLSCCSVLSCSESAAQNPEDSAIYPEARGYAQLVAHPPTGSLILFGGESNRRFSYESTWSYQIDKKQWVRLDGEKHPIQVGGTAAAYDEESDRIIYLFTTRLDSSAPRGLVRLSETWSLEVSTGKWTNMKPVKAPFGLMGARMAYDSESDRIILFGGADFTKKKAEWFNPTWSYDFNSNTWSEKSPAVAPPGRSYFGMSYDTQADRVLVFGGSPSDAAAELWAYDYNSDSWEAIEYSGQVEPDHHPSMVYDSSMNRSLFLVNETFSAFDYSTRSWSPMPRESDLGIRYFTAMAFDGATKSVVVFGGGPRGMRYNNDTWVFDTATEAWSRITEESSGK